MASRPRDVIFPAVLHLRDCRAETAPSWAPQDKIYWREMREVARSRAAAQDTQAGAAGDVSAQGRLCCCLKLPDDIYTKLEPSSSQR